jgi:hypothetical protein
MKIQPVSGLHNVQWADAANNRLGSFNLSNFGDRLHAAIEMALKHKLMKRRSLKLLI